MVVSYLLCSYPRLSCVQILYNPSDDTVEMSLKCVYCCRLDCQLQAKAEALEKAIGYRNRTYVKMSTAPLAAAQLCHNTKKLCNESMLTRVAVGTESPLSCAK